jgi:hypothetical protein
MGSILGNFIVEESLLRLFFLNIVISDGCVAVISIMSTFGEIKKFLGQSYVGFYMVLIVGAFGLRKMKRF